MLLGEVSIKIFSHLIVVYQMSTNSLKWVIVSTMLMMVITTWTKWLPIQIGERNGTNLPPLTLKSLILKVVLGKQVLNQKCQWTTQTEITSTMEPWTSLWPMERLPWTTKPQKSSNGTVCTTVKEDHGSMIKTKLFKWMLLLAITSGPWLTKSILNVLNNLPKCITYLPTCLVLLLSQIATNHNWTY